MPPAEENLPVVFEDHDALVSLELAEDAMILAEMQGRVIDTYMYEIKTAEGPKEGLTVAGVNFACREYAQRGEVIRIVGKPDILAADPQDPDYVIVAVMVQRFRVAENGDSVPLDNAMGIKRQWKKMEVGCKRNENGRPIPGTGKIVTDPFYMEKAVSKAVRNSKKALIPANVVLELLKLIKSGKAGAATAATAVQKAKAPPKPTAPSATQAAPPSAAPKAEAPPAEAKPAAAAPAAERPPNEPLVLAQKINAELSKKYKDSTVKKSIWKDLTGLDSLQGAPVAMLREVVAALSDGGEAFKSTSGKYVIGKKGGIVYPAVVPVQQVAPAASAPPDETQDELF